MRPTTLLRTVSTVAALAFGTSAMPFTPLGPASPAAAAETRFAQYLKPDAGPRGAVSVIGDSVMLGSVLETDGYGPSVAQMLVERAWGPVRVVAGVGLQTGRFTVNPGANMAKWVLDRRAEGWDPPTYMVGLGANDVGNCNTSQTCAEQVIMHLVDTIGPDRQIWWSMITMPSQGQADAWNNALLAVAARHPNVHPWNWPAALASSNIVLAADGVHLPTGIEYRKKSVLMADDFTTRMGVSHTAAAEWSDPAVIGGPSEYVPLTQNRMYDSRPGGSRPLHVQLDLTPYVPTGATAVSINVTAVAPPSGPAGFVVASPCGSAHSVASTVNFQAGQIRPNQAVVALGPGNSLCIDTSAPTDVIVDMQGAFVPSGDPNGDPGSPTGALRLNPTVPARLVDTRVTGRADPVVAAVPTTVPGNTNAAATAAAVNVTAVGAASDGHLVVYACDAPVPETSTLNFVAGAAAAASAYVALSAAGTVCVHASQPVDVIVDVQGLFAPASGLRFQPAVPQRMLDTRTGAGGWFGQAGIAQTVDVAVAPAAAAAVTGNLTLVHPGVNGYGSAYACSGAVPATSSVNAAGGDVRANAVTVAVSPDQVAGPPAKLCIHSSVGTHLLFDTTGWWIP